MTHIDHDAFRTEDPAGAQPGTTPRGAGTASETARFYLGVPAFSGFRGVADPRSFVPLPDDWTVGLTDVVSSTTAIEAGRYKLVNTAGAAVISAVSNALGNLEFPFIFGGDGASFAVAAEDTVEAAGALSATASWVGRELGLALRGATVRVAEIRAAGHDVRIARFSASPNVTYAMFSGGGLAWAEQRLKAGEIGAPPAPPDAQPDLTGLSCRFQDHKAKHGVILSVLVRPFGRPEEPGFRALVEDILLLVEQHPEAARPVPVFRPFAGLRLKPIGIDARLQHRQGQWRPLGYIRSAGELLLASVVLGLGMKLGSFSAQRYLREVVENSDFRKYDDSLMMTLDCDLTLAAAIEARLERAERDGVARFGLHRQAAATITCLVPSTTQANHVHFIDGASGGYAMAAQALKSRLASAGAV